MVATPQKMRLFAAECQRSAEQSQNARRRDLWMSIANSWIATAAGIERQTGYVPEVTPDLKPKPD
jgi:hypothetical protein